MSLIIDALKKAQQLRSKETRGAPFFKQPPPSKRGRRRWPWILGGSLLSLLILLLAARILFWTPSPVPPEPAITIAGKPISPEIPKREPPSEPVEEIPIPKPSIQVLAPAEEPKVKAILPSSVKIESSDAPVKPRPEEKVARSLKKEEKASFDEKSPPPAPPKEEVISKPVTLVKGSGKDDPLKTEIIQHFNSGVSYYHQGEISKAIQSYQKVIELDSNYIEAHNNLGIIYQEAGDFESALQFYQKALEINPRYEKALNNIGTIYHLKGENEKAIEIFRKILSFNPNHIESHIHLGTLYKKRGEMEKGIEAYQKALSIDPHYGVAHYHLGLLYEQTGNRPLAIQHYQQFVQLSSGSYPELASKVRRHIQQLLKTKGDKKE